MHSRIQLNSLYIDRTTGQTVRPTGFEEMGGVLKVSYHWVTNGMAQDMARFMPVDEFLACYDPLYALPPQFKVPWVVHFFKQPGKQTTISYNGQAVGHLSHLDVLYTREGSPRIFMQVEAPCVAIEDEVGSNFRFKIREPAPVIELPKCCICGCTNGTCPHVRAITQIPDTPIPAVQFVQEPADRTLTEAVRELSRETVSEVAEAQGKEVAAAKLQAGDTVLLMTELPHADQEGNLTSTSQTFQIHEVNMIKEGYVMPHVELIFTVGGKIVLPASSPIFRIQG